MKPTKQADIQAEILNILSPRNMDIITIESLLNDADVNNTSINLDEKVRHVFDNEQESDVDSYRDCLERLQDVKELLNQIMSVINKHYE